MNDLNRETDETSVSEGVKHEDEAIRGMFQVAFGSGDYSCGAGAFASEAAEGKICFWAEVMHDEDDVEMAEFYLSESDARHLALVLTRAADSVSTTDDGAPVVSEV